MIVKSGIRQVSVVLKISQKPDLKLIQESKKMEKIDYREMKSGQEREVCDLVAEVFNQYVAPDYTQEGIDEFFSFANHNAMHKRMQSEGFVLSAYKDNMLVGMVEYYPPNTIAMLFVTLRSHGIATELMDQAITRIRDINSGLTNLVVHSSKYAEPFYKKIGFKKMGDVITENGISCVPMELILTDNE